MDNSEQIDKLAGALAKAQIAFDSLTKDKTADADKYKYKYADLASVIGVIKKPLADNEIAYTQTIHQAERGSVLLTRLLHSSGQWIASSYPLPTQGTPQQIGSALTYARRYSLCAIVGIAAEEDDDGQGAGNINTDMRGSHPPPRPSRQRFQRDNPADIPLERERLTETPPANNGKSIKQAKDEISGCKTTEDIKAWREANADWMNRLEEQSPAKHDEMEAWIDNAWGDLSQNLG